MVWRHYNTDADNLACDGNRSGTSARIKSFVLLILTIDQFMISNDINYSMLTRAKGYMYDTNFVYEKAGV